MRVLQSIGAGALGVALVFIIIPLAPAQMVPLAPCEQKCQREYEDAAAVCGRMQDQAQKRACQDSAYAAYRSCRNNCQHQSNDCLEHCKKKCDDADDECRDRCKRKPKKDRQNCYSECSNKNGKCLDDCDKNCK